MASSKRKTRELAMQALFLWDTHGSLDVPLAQQLISDAAEEHDVGRAAIRMAKETWEQRESIDRWLERLAPQWPPRRQPAVDRNLLRLAVWELTNTNTPPKVVIDEAIEMAKHFSTEQSPSFVNGVLDAVLREHLALVGSDGQKSGNPVDQKPESSGQDSGEAGGPLPQTPPEA